MHKSHIPKVLVVDDIAENLLAMRVALKSLPVEITCVSSGEEALSQLINKEFQAILLDVRMPGLSGYETAALIHQQEMFEDIPIIFVTGNDKEHTPYELLYEREKIDYAFKPINSNEIKEKLRNLLLL